MFSNQDSYGNTYEKKGEKRTLFNSPVYILMEKYQKSKF
jgi:hypothetical protein